MVAGTDIDAAPAERAPRSTVGAVGWMRANLFSSWSNTLLTLVGLFIAYEAVSSVIGWALIRATFTGADGGACTHEGAGACWPLSPPSSPSSCTAAIPIEERWRVDLVYALALIGLVPLMIPSVPGKFWNAVYVFAIFPVVAFFLLVGGAFGLAACGHLAVGRPAGDAGRRHRRHHGVVPARHRAGAGAPVAHADRALGVGRLHRVRARRAADHRAVHGLRDAAAVPAARASPSTSCCGR